MLCGSSVSFPCPKRFSRTVSRQGVNVPVGPESFSDLLTADNVFSLFLESDGNEDLTFYEHFR